MVYDGMSSGVNRITWAPSFFLPTSATLDQMLESYSYQADMNAGEMFLNFPLDENVRKYCGVNLVGAGLGDLDGRYRSTLL